MTEPKPGPDDAPNSTDHPTDWAGGLAEPHEDSAPTVDPADQAGTSSWSHPAPREPAVEPSWPGGEEASSEPFPPGPSAEPTAPYPPGPTAGPVPPYPPEPVAPPPAGYGPPQQGYPPLGYGGPSAPPPYAPPPPPGSYRLQAPWRSGPDDTTWALLGHLSFFVLSIIAPLIIMLTKGKESGFVRDQAVEALNFHITVLIAAAVAGVLIIVIVGIVLLPIVLVAAAVFAIIAAVAASRGEAYRYPVNLRLVK